MRCVVALLLAVTLAAFAGTASANGVAVAVLGDSDSHSYRDSLNGLARGGENNAKTFNWLEIWERLRPDEVDPGPFARAGDSRWVAQLKAVVGVPTRTPAKLDYLYNYAWSGARCASLTEAWPDQARRFLDRLSAEPERWADGLVVIRIGINDFGQGEHLKVWAREPEKASPLVDACIEEIAESVAAIRKKSTVHIALVGIARDYNTPFAALSPAEIASAEAPLARFDDGLKALAARDLRIVFIDDNAWFEEKFGARVRGTLAESTLVDGLAVTNAAGDGTQFLHTADGHPGAVASGLFLQHFIGRLNEKFGWRLSIPSDEEIVTLAR